MTSNSNTKKPFRLRDLPDVPLFNCLRKMNTIDMIQLSTCSAMQKIIEKQVKIGNVSITLLQHLSILRIGNFNWHFFLKPTQAFLPTDIFSQKTIGPITMNVKEGENLWNSYTEEIMSPVYTLAQYLLRTFSKSTVEMLHYNTTVKDDTLNWVSSLDYSNCLETKIVVPDRCNQPMTTFFEGLCQNKQLVVMSSGLKNKPKIMHVKNFQDRTLPVDQDWWFTIVCVPKFMHHIILLSNIEVKEENIQKIIENWVEMIIKKLLFVRIKNVKKLDMGKILRNFNYEDWDDDTMETYKERPEFAKYFEEKGTIVRDKDNNIATINWNESESTFYFVVWDHVSMQNMLTFFANLPV